MRFTPRPSVSISSTFGRLNVSRYSSWKHGRLQNWRYQGLSASAVLGRRRSPRPVSGSAPSSRSRPTPSSSSTRRASCRPRRAAPGSSRLPMMSVQPSSTRSSASGMPDTRLLKFSMRRSCQPGSRLAAHSGSVGRLSRTSIDDGVRWNTYSCCAPAPRCGTHCTAVAPVPMMPTRLSARPVEAAVGAAAGVVVVPPAGVERVALEGRDALDAGQLRPVQRAAGHHDVAGAASRRRGWCRRSSGGRRRPSASR